MKKKHVLQLFYMLLFSVPVLSSCKDSNAEVEISTEAMSDTASQSETVIPESETQVSDVIESNDIDNNDTDNNDTDNNDAQGNGTANEDNNDPYTAFQPVLSENQKNDELENLILEYYAIPIEAANGISYMYNYIDLNQDGTDEVLAMLTGAYTYSTNGSILMYFSTDPASDGADSTAADSQRTYKTIQSFPGVAQPIIISDSQTNGRKDIIAGNPAAPYLILSYTGTEYTGVETAAPLTDLSAVSGTMLMINDVMQDREDGAALYIE
ncbi:MAG: hypothetical protein ACK5ML_03985 [Lachnospiraceae bacterium]